jgi:hypothetical protein
MAIGYNTQGSQTGSQCKQTVPHAGRLRATVYAARWPVRPHSPTLGDRGIAPSKQRVARVPPTHLNAARLRSTGQAPVTRARLAADSQVHAAEARPMATRDASPGTDGRADGIAPGCRTGPRPGIPCRPPATPATRPGSTSRSSPRTRCRSRPTRGWSTHRGTTTAPRGHCSANPQSSAATGTHGMPTQDLPPPGSSTAAPPQPPQERLLSPTRPTGEPPLQTFIWL